MFAGWARKCFLHLARSSELAPRLRKPWVFKGRLFNVDSSSQNLNYPNKSIPFTCLWVVRGCSRIIYHFIIYALPVSILGRKEEKRAHKKKNGRYYRARGEILQYIKKINIFF